MKINKFKVGMRVKILKCPAFWSSAGGGAYPLRGTVKYPASGIIVAMIRGQHSTAVNIKINNVIYGFDYNDLMKYENIIFNGNINNRL